MFGKKRLRARDFAEGLVHKCSSNVYESWREIQARISEATGDLEKPWQREIPEEYVPFVIIAGATADLQAAYNLAGQRQFKVLRKHVLERLGEALGNEVAEDLFSAYQEKWDKALERGENPMTFGIATALYDFLELPYVSEDQNGEFQSPLVLLALGDIVLSLVGFTKFALENYKMKG